MMGRSDSHFRLMTRSLLFTVVLLVASVDFASAARERITESPTASPSSMTPAPSKSVSPSEAPTPLASASPTKSPAPSQAPSNLASSAPSPGPTAKPSTSPPTSSPSTSPPTLSPTSPPTSSPSTSPPTGLPTKNPTNSPTAEPTLSPTSHPTISSAPTFGPTMQPTSVVTIPIPQTVLIFFVRAVVPGNLRRLQEELDLGELELRLNAFFTNVLKINANFKKSFESLQLYTDPTFDAETGQVNVTLTGDAMFRGAEVPTEEELGEVFLTYFSFFGADDLETFLEDSYPDLVVSGLTLEIGGTKIEGSPVDPGNRSIGDDDDPNSGLIFGLVIGGLASLVLVGVSLRYRNKLLSQPTERGLVLDDDDTNPNLEDSPRMGVSPRRMFATGPQTRERSPPPPAPQYSDIMSSEQDARSLSGMISLEESLFTTDAESYAPRGSFQYDASRLDQVISSAKGFAKELDTDDEEGLL